MTTIKYLENVWQKHEKLPVLVKKQRFSCGWHSLDSPLSSLSWQTPVITTPYFSDSQTWHFRAKPKVIKLSYVIILVFCYQNCTDLLWEKIVLVIQKKLFEIRGWRSQICKMFEITRTIYSNSERSEKILVTECFLTFSMGFLISYQWSKDVLHILL